MDEGAPKKDGASSKKGRGLPRKTTPLPNGRGLPKGERVCPKEREVFPKGEPPKQGRATFPRRRGESGPGSRAPGSALGLSLSETSTTSPKRVFGKSG